MASPLLLFLSLTIVRKGVASQLVSFDGATASSIRSSGDVTGTYFAPSQALSPGNGYWCSAGNHSADEVVSWTGVLGARHKAEGVQVNWAYAPGDMKVLVSPDGANFAEASAWRASPTGMVTFVDHIMLDTAVPVVAISIVMRRVQKWNYFGLNSIGLLVKPGPVMFVSGAAIPSGPVCLVSTPDNHNVLLSSCLDAIAAGNGEEIFVMGEDGTLSSAVGSDRCLQLASISPSDSKTAMMGSCRYAIDARDGRAIVAPDSSGQIRFPSMGNYCVSLAGELLSKDVAVGAVVRSTSSQMAHPPEHAIDAQGGSSTYWASAIEGFNNASVDLTIEFGESVHVESIEIDWELPAKDFDVKLGNGGFLYPLYETNTNAMKKTIVAPHGKVGRVLQIHMRHPQPVESSVASGFAYAIRNIRVVASAARVIAADCAEASESGEARDKFSAVFVPEFDPAPANSARTSAELALKASDRLSGWLAMLANSLAALEHCGLNANKTCSGENCMNANVIEAVQFPTHLDQREAKANGDLHWAGFVASIDKQLGIDKLELAKLIDNANNAVAAVKRNLNE